MYIHTEREKKERVRYMESNREGERARKRELNLCVVFMFLETVDRDLGVRLSCV